VAIFSLSASVRPNSHLPSSTHLNKNDTTRMALLALSVEMRELSVENKLYTVFQERHKGKKRWITKYAGEA
jgi:hypothetical protein